MPYPTPATGPAGSAATGAADADEQALNQLKYKRLLEQFAGFAPGESDLSDDEILRRRALAAQAQAQGQQAQAVAGSVPAGATPQAAYAQVPFQNILNLIRMHPGMALHLEGIDPVPAPVQGVQMGPAPTDPASRVRWQRMMGDRQHQAQVVQTQRAQRKEQYNQHMVQMLRMHDPHFHRVIRWMDSFVDSLPVSIQQSLRESASRQPGLFLELYAYLRDHFLQESHRIQHGHPALVKGSMPPHGSTDPRARIRQAVAGRMSPPALESAGLQDDRLPAANRKAELAAIKARLDAGKARKGDSLRYIELTSPQRWGRA